MGLGVMWFARVLAMPSYFPPWKAAALGDIGDRRQAMIAFLGVAAHASYCRLLCAAQVVGRVCGHLPIGERPNVGQTS